MVKDDLAAGALFEKFESGNRIDARRPVARSPGLDNPHVRHKLDMSSCDEPAVERKRASRFPADLCGFVRQMHRLQGSAELYDASKLFGIGKSFVDAPRARFENGLLVNGLRRARYPILGSRPGPG